MVVRKKLLLPGITTLTRLISRVKIRCNSRLWRILSQLPSEEQAESLKSLLKTTKKDGYSELDQLKKAPTRISGPALIDAINRYKKIKSIGIRKLDFSNIPVIKIRDFARYTATSWAPSIARMPEPKKIAMLVSFAYIYEIQALDDILNLLDMLITDVISLAKRNGEKNRLRSLRDLDKSSSELASFAQLFLDNESKSNLVQLIYETIPKQQITNAITTIKSLTRKKHDKYYEEMLEQFIRIRRFLPVVFKTINFKPTESGQNVYDAIKFLHSIEGKKKSTIDNAPKEIINESWRHLVINKTTNTIDRAGYKLCVLDNLQSNMRSKNLFVEDSEKWCDPRTKLLSGDRWLTQRTPVCKLLGLPIEALDAAFLLSNDLDIAYSTILANFNANDNLEIIENNNGKKRIKLSKLEKVEDPKSLISLRNQIYYRG